MGAFQLYTETFISLRFGFHINPDEFDATTSLYEFYEQHGVELGYADETIEARIPSLQVRTELFMKEPKCDFISGTDIMSGRRNTG